MSVREGMDPAVVREVATAILALAGKADGVRDEGSALLSVLAGAWEGPDVATFQQGWERTSPVLDEAAAGLRRAGEDLRRQADDQVETSGGEGSGTGGGGWGGLDLPDLAFPDLGDPFDGMGWEMPTLAWPQIDWKGLWDGFLDLLEGIGDWWDDLPWWGQLILGVIGVAVGVVIAILAGLEIAAVILAIIAIVGTIMSILDLLDSIAELLRDPEAFIKKLLEDPLALLDDIIWFAIGLIPFGVGKLLKGLRKPIKELLERITPWLKKKGDEIADWFRKKRDEVASKVNDWDKQLRRKFGLGAKELKNPPPNTFPDPKKVQKKYSAHAKDFGLVDEKGNPLPWNKANGEKFRKAVDDHVNDPDTKHYDGYYRGDPAILDYNPKTGMVVVRKPNGDFVSGWKASADQARNIEQRGSLQ